MHLTEQIEYQEAGFAYSESEEGFRQIVETLPEDQGSHIPAFCP